MLPLQATPQVPTEDSLQTEYSGVCSLIGEQFLLMRAVRRKLDDLIKQKAAIESKFVLITQQKVAEKAAKDAAAAELAKEAKHDGNVTPLKPVK